MNAQALIRDLEAEIQAAEGEGRTKIKLENLKAYLREIKKIVEEQNERDALQTQRDLAFYAAKHSSRIEYYKAKSKRISDDSHAVITIGQGALKSSILINGGACVALLAFIGKIITENTVPVPGLSTALLIFGCGVLFSAISSGTTYLSQSNYAIKKRRRAVFYNYLVIVFIILSYLSFLGGGIISWWAIYYTKGF